MYTIPRLNYRFCRGLLSPSTLMLSTCTTSTTYDITWIAYYVQFDICAIRSILANYTHLSGCQIRINYTERLKRANRWPPPPPPEPPPPEPPPYPPGYNHLNCFTIKSLTFPRACNNNFQLSIPHIISTARLVFFTYFPNEMAMPAPIRINRNLITSLG